MVVAGDDGEMGGSEILTANTGEAVYRSSVHIYY
jgi:hypothetical protein